MILLDTNYLIRLLVPGTEEANAVLGWSRERVPLVTSAVCWYEFSCGPVTDREKALVRSLLGPILPLGEPEADRAAELFNRLGRLRTLRVDCLVAGTALVADARVASSNLRDFTAFVPMGLQLTKAAGN